MFKESFANVEEESNNINITGESFVEIDDEVALQAEQKLQQRIQSEVSLSENDETDRDEEYDELMRMESEEDDETDDEEMVVESDGMKKLLIYFGVGILVAFVIGLLIKIFFFNKKK
mgnify:CR=1 FL=1